MAYTLDNLIWNSDKKRWFTPKGRALPDAALDKLIVRTQTNYLQDVIQYTNRLVSGQIKLADWEKLTAIAIKDSHVAMMRVGRGGSDQTFGIHYLDVANELRNNQYPYFRQLVLDLKDGKLSRKQLDNRLKNYIKASKTSYQKGRATYGDQQYAVRKINEKAENCPDCLRYAAMGVVLASQLPLPMTACQCGANCKCSIYYGTEADLLKKRNGWLN